MRTKKRKAEPEEVEIPATLTVARWLWPDFVRVGAGTFLQSSAPSAEYLDTWWKADLLGAEAFFNHTHVFDVFLHRAHYKRAWSRDRRHRDFAAGCLLGALMCETWAAKLRLDFPEEDYAVFCTRENEPIVRFHKIGAGGELWTEVSANPLGTVLLIRSKHGRRLGALVPPGPRKKARRRPSRVG